MSRHGVYASQAQVVRVERILLIEDGPAVQRAVKRLFESEGYDVQVAPDGQVGLDACRTTRPDLVVLDLGLPGMPGREVCCQIKKEAPSLPIIILSAKTDVWDKVLLLELGADDYVTKPFSPRELLARVRGALRRRHHPATTDDIFSFGDVVVDFAKMQVTRGGQSVTLTAQEFKVLKFFAQNPERVISREELLNQVWGYNKYPSTRTVDNHILKLRQKLERDPEFPVHFRTVHNVGYKFVA